MKERPLLFSGPMVRAILAGQKTMTRRPLKVQPLDVIACKGKDLGRRWTALLERKPPRGCFFACRYGVPGDRIWVRETLRMHGHFGFPLGATPQIRPEDHARIWSYAADNVPNYTGSRPSIHMPRWACRLVLELTHVRVQRLGDISEKDARAEGITRMPWPSGRGHGWAHDEGQPVSTTAVRAFEDLWHSIHGAWLPETWVWYSNSGGFNERTAFPYHRPARPRAA